MERAIKHHGISKDHFSLYLKELEFRYNNRHAAIFDKGTNYFCELIPSTNNDVLFHYITWHAIQIII